MECNCAHQKVCPYAKKVCQAFNSIIEMRFGGRSNKWNKVEECIQSVCEYRDEIKENK